ncbi:hypothetical protein P692DRAFT_20876732 [Suillus brevipes Sb2]|nr:hypothetical protein P692DRAFT_20876732 [Suillus brevipes Sb2]
MPVPHFSAEQRCWLDNQIDIYNYCNEYDDLVMFWTSLFEVFFTCWPEHEVLFPDLHSPAPLSFTNEQKQVLDDAVVTRKHRIQDWICNESSRHTNTLEGCIPFTIVSMHDHTMVLQVEEELTEFNVEDVGSTDGNEAGTEG